MALVEIKVEIAAGAVSEADNALLELGAANWSVVEDAIEKRAWLVGILATGPAPGEGWEELEPQLAAAGVVPLGRPARRVLAESDWRDSYKAHFKAWKFGRLHWVPAWERATFVCPPGEEVLWLDPGLAFGTGNHETTRLVVEQLVAHAARRGTAGRVIDAGCGSGILALSAARLGFGKIEAFDCDPEAIRVSQENAAENALSGRVDFFVGDLASGLAGRRADLVLANIQADVLTRSAGDLVAVVVPGGELVLSGILERELGEVRGRFAEVAPGWRMESQVLGEWSAISLNRPT